MLIQKIQIQNITTHINTEIEFKPGINSLMGENGAGKSSVLLMIGYLLFDYLPGRNQKMYVRMDSKKKFGEVKLWILANDGENYVIRRTIGKKANELSVTHCETNIILKEIATVSDLREWLHEILGIRYNLPLKTIFDGGIGVRQGTFTEPFLRNPTERAQVFSPLLNVDIYSKLHKNFLTTIKELEENIHQQDLLVNRLSGELSEKQQQMDNKEKLENLLKDSKKKLSVIENQWKSVKKQFNRLTEIKDNLEKLKSTQELTKRDIQGQKSTISELNLNLEQAKTASDICQKTEKVHLEYLNLEKQHKILMIQIKAWRISQEILADLKNRITGLKGRHQQIAKSIGEIEKFKEELPKLEKIHKQFEESKKMAEKMQFELLQITKTEKKIKDLDIEIQKRHLIPVKLEKIQEELLITKNGIASLKVTADKLQQNQIQCESIQNQIKELQSYIKQAKSGICPVCDQTFHSEHQDLTSYFQEKVHNLEKITTKQQLVRKTLKENLVEVSKLEDRKEKCIRLETQYKEKLIAFQEKSLQMANYHKEIQNKKSLETKLQNIKKEINNLAHDNQRFEFISVKIKEELSQLQTELGKIQKDISELLTKSHPLEKEVEKGREFDTNLNEMSHKLEKLKPSHEKYQENHRIAQNMTRISENLQEKIKEMQAANEILHLTTNKIKKIAVSFDAEEYKMVESQKSTIQIHLIQKKEEYKQINMQMDQIKQRLTQLKEKEIKLLEYQKKLELLKEIDHFSDTIRNWYKEAGPKVTEALISDINVTASTLYRQIKGEETVSIEWQKDYNVIVKSSHISERVFTQLSGGEQMAVALSIRLAILKILTKIDFAFFDEPTTNLDENKRINLAQCIQNIRGFQQIFIISHDDTFEEYADNVIRFSKTDKEETRIETISF
ncbi:MAG: AAA family ATPase [Promethearchaeota archaeon]